MARMAVNTRPVRLPLGATGFARVSGVSRETLASLEAYAGLLTQWSRRINLVSPNSLGDIWRRHILDSAQLFRLIPRPATAVLVDIGSGAGLPGLILAAMGIGEVHLVESDLRKAAFLREAARIMGCAVTVHACRAESISGLTADIVTARACAPLDQLLGYAEHFIGRHTACLFLKGEGAAAELAGAQTSWTIKVETLPSLSDPSGTILKLTDIKRAPA
jgi:16S rRNA (guanine527-N7)-methyltransferase